MANLKCQTHSAAVRKVSRIGIASVNDEVAPPTVPPPRTAYDIVHDYSQPPGIQGSNAPPSVSTADENFEESTFTFSCAAMCQNIFMPWYQVTNHSRATRSLAGV